MTSEQLLREAKEIALENKEFVSSILALLTEEQLNWRSSGIGWNIKEILAHVNVFSSFYYDTFRRKIEKTRFRKSKEAFMSTPLGRSAWKAMKLGNAKNVKRRFKSVRMYNPSVEQSLINGKEREQFIKDQELFLGILESAAEVNLKRVKIPISLSKIIRFRLGDAILYVSYHNQRHLQQIRNLMTHPKFPVAAS